MKLGIVISSNDPETVWNAFRLGKFALGQGDTVNVFLLGKGVECESLDTEHFAVTQAMQDLADSGGKIDACGTCLKLRNAGAGGVCALATMQDLYRLASESDRVLTF
ncbi:DsrE family protein [Thiobacillus denitrificans]|uniref:Sulfur reduction protein DsrE n=1 Tax=Thiobacillus denitrificans TaxID=36861 RepID=A0A106BEV0_THIDE|nr:DsrE family protein [Thiobacillus denitrificans]KVW91326.1 sulfur reduction protein DsrE [Thiobacillus denitrificans]